MYNLKRMLLNFRKLIWVKLIGGLNGISRHDLQSIIELVRPVKTDLLLHRVGGNADGGYIMPQSILPDVVVSPGVSFTSTFEEYYADKGAICHLFDYSVDRPGTLHKNFRFYKKFWALHKDDMNIDCSNWLKENIKKKQFSILQMDIEGAEYQLFSSYSFKEEIQKFDIIVIEFHKFEKFISRKNYLEAETIFCDTLKYFDVIHFHQNNNYHNYKYKGLDIVSDFELTMINKNKKNIKYNVLGIGDFSLRKFDQPNVQGITHLFPNW